MVRMTEEDGRRERELFATGRFLAGVWRQESRVHGGGLGVLQHRGFVNTREVRGALKQESNSTNTSP